MHKLNFNNIVNLNWKEIVSDKQASSWQDNWFLDGDKARILFAHGNIPGEKERGLELYSGPNTKADDCHSVLWSKKEFSGNVKISFDYTRLDRDDENNTSVCIVYLLAQGSGEKGYEKDISKWNDKRTIPSMNIYFNHMNLYHISFAAFDEKNDPRKYIRARQYKAGEFLGTNIAPDYDPQDLFLTGVTYHIDAIKFEDYLFFKANNLICSWNLDKKTLLNSGRIGIRQMAGRSGRFSNITISTLN